jgi:hypothetical protein
VGGWGGGGGGEKESEREREREREREWITPEMFKVTFIIKVRAEGAKI